MALSIPILTLYIEPYKPGVPPLPPPLITFQIQLL